MAKLTEEQRHFVINTTARINRDARTKSKPPSPNAAKDCQIRRDIEWHMDQRRLKQELADFGITDETLL